MGTAKDNTPRLLHEINKLFFSLWLVFSTVPEHTILLQGICGRGSYLGHVHMSPWRIFSLNLMGEFTCILEACFTAHQSDTKAHSCLRVAPFMDAEYLLVEFIIVQHPPSPRLTGGNDATVSCFKDDINIQIGTWVTVWFVAFCFVSLCMLCIVCFPHRLDISGMK